MSNIDDENEFDYTQYDVLEDSDENSINNIEGLNNVIFY